MAGGFLSVDVLGQSDITNALNKLIKQGQGLEPAFREIGEHLLQSHEQRFNQQVSPEGEPWEPLKDLTIARKAQTNQSDKILRGHGSLADLLNYQLGSNQLMFGSPMEYAAMHQFGGTTAANSMIPGKKIPARPFLGLSDDDDSEVLDILRSHLNKAL